MRCPSCDADNREDASFCDGCGSALPRVCPACQAQLRLSARFCDSCGQAVDEPGQRSRTPTPEPAVALPESFAGGRYQVRRFLGEGGRKRVYQAHDSRLDRDVAIAVIKTEGLDETGRTRVQREAQAMGRLGDHPHIVTIHDVGDENGQTYIVSQYMAGGDLEGALQRADDHQLPAADVLRIGGQICGALEHAHERGIIHRDLKPGNVWLTEDGDAKLGDFGLAVAFDRSRVTMEGMMVGTVAYMPPEQALGRQADARSDLYSLGCVLYEALTGRPPFAGDDPTAVISQHINTSPVAPSWHTEHCPPDLEELVLRLLAKDPDQRPASAAEVLAALGKIDPAQKSASHSESNVLDRLARGVFVGREQELERLRKAFDAAISGQGGLVMLVGEPGIGKTRTAQELETYARMRGAAVLWGMGHESAGAPSYWPWMQVGRMYGSTHDLAELVPDMGAIGGHLVKIFPELPQILVFAEPETMSDPEAAQFQLFDAYTTFIRAIAKRMPLVITLDDLHWADKPSLSLLRHLARELSRLRVLVVGTFRDTELARTHPLSEALAALNREPGFQRVVLRGLSREEVAGYIRAVANLEPARPLLDRIYEETEGNPFFLSEVVTLLTQEGAFTRQSVSDIAVPDGVREALGRRLDTLSEEANELLGVAAIAGREFTYETLSLLSENQEELLHLIEEALEARVIEEMPQPGRYRFTHALMQETLLGELSTTRRVRIHGQVAEALERRWGERADERATRLARHFVEAAMLSPRHAEKAAHYSKLAARQAEAQYAWDEAARHYEDCLTLVAGAEERSDEDEAELLVALGVSARNAGDYRKSWRSLMRAIDLYREVGDAAGMARATIQALLMVAPPDRQAALVKEALAALGHDEPYLEAQLLVYSMMPRMGGGAAPGLDEGVRARLRELVDAHDFKDVRAHILGAEAGLAFREGELKRGTDLMREAHETHAELGLAREAANDLFFVSNGEYFRGRLDEGMASAQEGLEYAHRHHLRYFEENCAGAFAVGLLARCQFAEFDALAEERSADDSFFIPMLAASRREMAGDIDRAVALLPEPAAAGGYPPFLTYIHGTRARVFLNAGRLEDAREEFARAREVAAMDPGAWVVDGIPIHGSTVSVLDEAVPILGDAAFVAAAAKRLTGDEYKFEIGRSAIRAQAALALHIGDGDQAERRYKEALDWCRRERCPVEEGRCHYGLAEVAQTRGQVGEALQHLDRAAALFQEHGARLYLDRAIAKKLELQGVSSTDIQTSIDAVAASVYADKPDLRPHAAPDGTVTILFSDIEGSTAMTERLGDKRWMELLREHNAIVREKLKAHGGFEVKSAGDGFMLAFGSARRALECAIDIQRALAERNASLPAHPEPVEGRAEPHAAAHTSTSSARAGRSVEVEPIRVRIGLHTGEAIKDGEDFFGKHVNLAARIAGQASGGEIWVSSLLKELTDSSGDIAFADEREVELKGLSGTQRVFAVGWE